MTDANNRVSKNFVLGIERNINPTGADDLYTGNVETMGQEPGISAQGSTADEVRRKLNHQIIKRIEAGEFTTALPPRAWREVVTIRLTEQESRRVTYA